MPNRNGPRTLAARAIVIAAIDAALARADELIGLLDTIDGDPDFEGDPDLESDYVFAIKDKNGRDAWFGTSTDQEEENEHCDLAEEGF